MEQKVAKLNKDGNKAAKGGNWPVFDFCNQFLQVMLMVMVMMMMMRKINMVWTATAYTNDTSCVHCCCKELLSCICK